MSKAVLKSLAVASTLSLTSLLSFSSNATIVEVETSQGNFKINLHDQTTPKTVENFLKYVTDGDYNNTVVHRLVPNFVMQTGGYSLEGGLPLTPINTNATVKNEPVYSSVQGTIAMAKPGNNPNGATSQWFVNYKDNSSILDTQNGGFTVFGEVIEGMDNINSMADLLICREVPMPDYTAEQCADVNFVPGVENFVTIHSITVIDSTVVTDATLSSVKNTSLSTSEPDGGGGGGSLSYFALLSLAFFGLRRRIKNA